LPMAWGLLGLWRASISRPGDRRLRSEAERHGLIAFRTLRAAASIIGVVTTEQIAIPAKAAKERSNVTLAGQIRMG
jgi:hypothetical protein